MAIRLDRSQNVAAMLLAAWLLAPVTAPPALGQVLYDGSLGTLPGGTSLLDGSANQGWIYSTTPILGSSATQTLGGGAVTLDTTAVRDDMAGYFSKLPPFGAHPNSPTLDRSVGYTLRVDVRIDDELHVSPNRAGFSIIVLSSDSLGVEIGFWEDEVFVLEDDVPTFSHAEGAAFDTTAGVVRYEVTVLGANYSITADGQPLLAGPLRDYTSFGLPYTLTDFIFLGDDTSSAQGVAELAFVEVRAIPTPATAALLAPGLILLLTRRRAGSTRLDRISDEPWA